MPELWALAASPKRQLAPDRPTCRSPTGGHPPATGHPARHHRRCLRPRHRSRNLEAPALPPVLSLHNYLPVIEELLANPLAAGDCESLWCRLAAHPPDLFAEIDHQLP